MPYYFSNPQPREVNPWAVPDLEVFHVGQLDELSCPVAGDGQQHNNHHEHLGWYYWFCQPGCLPNTEAMGPFKTEQEALDTARDPSSVSFQFMEDL